MSGHDAQLITISNITIRSPLITTPYTIHSSYVHDPSIFRLHVDFFMQDYVLHPCYTTVRVMYVLCTKLQRGSQNSIQRSE